jgi:hypothetical protein
MLSGEPMQFLAQLPLDSAREAGLLPFEVPPGSLLTVFFTGDWDNPASSQNGSLLIHGVDDLAELSPPSDQYQSSPLCRLRPEVTDLYPTPAAALEIVAWELDGPDRASLKGLEEKYGREFPNPRDRTRVGGYPNWIQGHEDEAGQFVAQLASDEAASLDLGDGGALYILGDSPQSLTAVFQCY